jgi:hypothetical protein
MLEAHHDRDVLIVTVTGAVNSRHLALLLHSLQVEARPVVLDLSELMPVGPSPAPFGDRLAHGLDRSISVVCRRPNARRLLRSWGFPEVVKLYASVEDAQRETLPCPTGSVVRR